MEHGAGAQEPSRPRDLGLVIGELPPGPGNAITDVPGVRVGHVTLVEGQGAHVPGRGPVRTGVTAILPNDWPYRRPVAAAAHVINGFGKSAGLMQLDELGRLETPLVLTNTLSVGAAAEGIVRWTVRRAAAEGLRVRTVNPVVAECNDGRLNDIEGLHVRPEHVLRALEQAAGGPVAEGAVGAGTGMVCFGFKGGIGTASRRLRTRMAAEGGETEGVLGALVLANFGRRGDLVIDGVPVGRLLAAEAGPRTGDPKAGASDAGAPRAAAPDADGAGSVIVVLATDLPLTHRQLRRVAVRAVVGLVRCGGRLEHGSGDVVIAFSTARRYPPFVDDEGPFLEPLFRAAGEATEEAVLNALFAARDMDGRDGIVIPALPRERVLDLLRRR